MKTCRRDIAIVGAGPAGASAALAACARSLRVLVVDRKASVGKPIRCAEYIPAPLLQKVSLDRGFVEQKVQGMRTVLPSGEIKITRAPGYTIRRDLFDQGLVQRAREAGAEIWLSARVLEREGNALLIRHEHGISRVEAKVIIGADGPHSTVGKWIGSVNKNLIPAVQVRVPLRSPMDYTEVCFDRDIFGGYGWLFPKGREANVGLGMKGRDGRLLGKTLKDFLARLAREGKIREAVKGYVAGWIPAERPRRITMGNILLAGDAAGQTHPVSGAGVAQAVICGRMAGKWAARAAETKDSGALPLYEEEWLEMYGESQERAYKRRRFMESEWERLDDIIKKCWIAFREYYVGS